MKPLIGLFLIIIIGIFAAPYLPWWGTIAIAALVAFLLRTKTINSFWLGFWSLFLLWGGMSLWLDSQNQGVLSDIIGRVFQLNGLLLIGVTALLGGILGGLASMSGSLGRQLFHKVEKSKEENILNAEIQ